MLVQANAYFVTENYNKLEELGIDSNIMDNLEPRRILIDFKEVVAIYDGNQEGESILMFKSADEIAVDIDFLKSCALLKESRKC